MPQKMARKTVAVLTTKLVIPTVETDDAELAKLPPGLKLVPGMPIETFMRTDDRTILSYVLKPLTDQIDRAFR